MHHQGKVREHFMNQVFGIHIQNSTGENGLLADTSKGTIKTFGDSHILELRNIVQNITCGEHHYKNVYNGYNWRKEWLTSIPTVNGNRRIGIKTENRSRRIENQVKTIAHQWWTREGPNWTLINFSSTIKDGISQRHVQVHSRRHGQNQLANWKIGQPTLVRKLTGLGAHGDYDPSMYIIRRNGLKKKCSESRWLTLWIQIQY